MRRLSRTAAALSALFNVVVLGGRPGEMASGKLARLRDRHGCVWCARVCAVLDWLTWEVDHCRRAHESDLLRARALLEGIDDGGRAP